MKNPKRPTRRQKEQIEQRKLNPENWFVERDTVGELVLINKQTGKQRILSKGVSAGAQRS